MGCTDTLSDFQESSSKTAIDSNHHAPVMRESLSLGSVCVLGESWLELLADRVQLLILFLRQRKFSEGACISFPKEKAHFYFAAVIGLNFSEIGREYVNQ